MKERDELIFVIFQIHFFIACVLYFRMTNRIKATFPFTDTLNWLLLWMDLEKV